MTLSAIRVKSLTEAGRYGDGNGLYLSIAKTGTKSWVQRIRHGGKRRDVGLGGFPTIALATAREWAAENRSLVAEGKAPLSGKDRRAAARRARTPNPSKPTFRSEAEAFFGESIGTRWTNAKNQKQRPALARRYIFPHIGDKPIDQIDGADVLNLLIPLQREKPEIAKTARTLMKLVFSRAQARGLIQVNPAGEIIRGGLPPRTRKVQHMPTLHYSQVAGALAKVDASEAFEATKLGFRFMVLCASRPGEVRFAEWADIDLDAALWIIPAEKMKSDREHRVSLSRQAVEVLRVAKMLTWDSVWVFESDNKPGRPLSENAFNKLARDLRLCGTPHGFRSSFKDWAEERSGASYAAIEMSLAHAVGNLTERAYFRSDLLDQRRRLVQAWADYLDAGH